MRKNGENDDYYEEKTSDGDHKHLASLTVDCLNSVEHVDVAAGAAAVQEAVEMADSRGRNKVVVYGDEAEWTESALLPDDFTLEFRDGVTVNASVTADDVLITNKGGQDYGGLITNADHESGNENITVRGGYIDFDAVDDNSIG